MLSADWSCGLEKLEKRSAEKKKIVGLSVQESPLSNVSKWRWEPRKG